MMDFSKFRETGDLSDITVSVEQHEHKLHKFPLYARSDYFCELARTKPPGDPEPTYVQLDNFPGGNVIFEQVANFCYNMALNLSKNNVVDMRCAAEYLKMFGPGNLADISNKFLHDTISSAKLSRSTAAIIAMLTFCNNIGELSQKAGIVDTCSDALVDCWLRPPSKGRSGDTAFSTVQKGKDAPSAFKRIQAPVSQNTPDVLDEVSHNCLMSLRVDWFGSILAKARSRGVSLTELGNLAVSYISLALDKANESSVDPQKVRDRDSEEETISPCTESEKESDTLAQSPSNNGDASTSVGSRKAESFGSGETLDVGYILDKIVLGLPEQAFNIPAVTIDWLTKALRFATSHDCECRDYLVRVAAEMLVGLGPEELCIISPSVLHDIVVEHKGGDSAGTTGTAASQHNDRACKLVDTYMSQMTAKGLLTSETFRLLASATKNYPRASHDSLFNVLEFILTSEQEKLTPEQRSELTKLVNLDLVSETCLQKALNEEMVPVSEVASSAIKLCSRLRAELSSIKYIAEMQELDIQKYQSAATAAVPTITAAPPAHVTAEHRTFSAFSPRERLLDSNTSAGSVNGLNRSRDKSPMDLLKAEDLDASQEEHTTDPLKAAQNVLTAARHKLALPIYTGYRPVHLSRMSPTTSSAYTYTHSHTHRGTVEHDITLEEELEFKFDRSFHSLDPRVRQQRLMAHHHGTTSGHRTYFPYSHYSHRY